MEPMALPDPKEGADIAVLGYEQPPLIRRRLQNNIAKSGGRVEPSSDVTIASLVDCGGGTGIAFGPTALNGPCNGPVRVISGQVKLLPSPARQLLRIKDCGALEYSGDNAPSTVIRRDTIGKVVSPS